MSIVKRLFLAVLLCAAPACTHNEPLSLHGAGSMRVEVQVYKGPLTVSTSAQIGQMAAVLGETVRALDAWKQDADYAAMLKPCPGFEAAKATAQRNAGLSVDAKPARLTLDDQKGCEILGLAMKSSVDAIASACFIIHTPAFERLREGTYLPINTCRRYPGWTYLYAGNPWPRDNPVSHQSRTPGISSAGDIPAPYQNLENSFALCEQPLPGATKSTPSDKQTSAAVSQFEMFKCYQEPIVIALESFATALRSSAFRLADSNVRYVPHDRAPRGLVVAYAYVASEYGNLIASRVALLQKQLADGRDPKLLPMSDYLRDSRTSDFINLFDWLDAARSEYPFRNEPGRLTTEERVRMAQRLTADYYWEKVNEVYASGQGDVSMAYVKDALGNWDLKSFSNDPSELLASYRKVTDAALTTAAKLARSAAGGAPLAAGEKLSRAARAAAFADQIAGGSAPAAEEGEVAAMHAQTARLLKARGDRLLTQQANLAQDYDNKDAALYALQQSLPAPRTAEDQKKVDDAQAARDAVKLRLDGLNDEAIAAMRDVLQEHQSTIAARQGAIVASQPKKVTP